MKLQDAQSRPSSHLKESHITYRWLERPSSKGCLAPTRKLSPKFIPPNSSSGWSLHVSSTGRQLAGTSGWPCWPVTVTCWLAKQHWQAIEPLHPPRVNSGLGKTCKPTNTCNQHTFTSIQPRSWGLWVDSVAWTAHSLSRCLCACSWLRP